jgi:hypothetical protein
MKRERKKVRTIFFKHDFDERKNNTIMMISAASDRKRKSYL